MTTFRLKIDPRRKARARLLGDVHTQVANAFEEEKEEHGLTRREVADKLGWDKGALTRKLKPSANITLETLADLGFALDRQVLIFFVRPQHAQAVRHCAEGICQSWLEDNWSYSEKQGTRKKHTERPSLSFSYEPLAVLRSSAFCRHVSRGDTRPDRDAPDEMLRAWDIAMSGALALIRPTARCRIQAIDLKSELGVSWRTSPEGTVHATGSMELGERRAR